MMRTIVAVIALLFIPFVAADQRMDAAIASLRQQVNLIVLAEPHNDLIDYQARLASTAPITTNELQELSASISDFWQRHGIAIREPELLSDKDVFVAAAALEPDIEGYLGLSNRLRYLTWLASQQSWQTLTTDKWLKPGDSHADIPEITSRLIWLRDYRDGYSQPNDRVDYYDKHLRDAVLRFQTRHGLKADGIIGPATLRWLNFTPMERARMLAFNFVERAKYMADVGDRYLLINIPAYEMVLVDEDRVALQSRVIVGKPYRPTPIIKGEISSLVLNPSWNVPRKLVKLDLLPKVRKDGSYLSRLNFEVFNYAGERVTKTAEEWSDSAKGQFPYRLVQKPGERNTLGRYKFFFANEFSVYLHDTTEKGLFARSDRALSSGCIRVEKVEQLANWMASYLVSDKQTWVDMQIERTKTQWFAFNDKLPLHLVYWTSWLDEQNIAQFRDDIYNINQDFSGTLHAQNTLKQIKD
ncbi:L,D-transpeptidase family protein [Shewanella sp. AS1]|uniref:L,D-transpeptidase family protein n=1 Tax=Shewanella sp. AS1 TaxID=2907626 RepID=UPI001F021596|nr:L,D-transpeptidase family protein [Shewanella sp. AS1]MCE9678838.1 L,D-transpeptidase family protein [Shewanella sp. AS1]